MHLDFEVIVFTNLSDDKLRSKGIINPEEYVKRLFNEFMVIH